MKFIVETEIENDDGMIFEYKRVTLTDEDYLEETLEDIKSEQNPYNEYSYEIEDANETLLVSTRLKRGL